MSEIFQPDGSDFLAHTGLMGLAECNLSTQLLLCTTNELLYTPKYFSFLGIILCGLANDTHTKIARHSGGTYGN